MKKTFTTGGFTVIELLVALAIFAVVSGIVMYNYSKFNTNILVTNLAYDTVLSIRKAQVYGVAVHERVAGSQDFSSSYGVHFDISDQTSFVFFADTTSGGSPNRYNAGVGAGELLSRQSLPSKYTYSKFCVTSSASVTKCSDTDPSLQYLDLSFMRPEPDAIIRTADTSHDVSDVYTQATICVQSPLGRQRKIIISSTGQVSLSATLSCS